MATSPFHAGEKAIQERAGVGAQAERGGRMVRPAMPDQHRDLFEALPYLVVGAVVDGWPRATFLSGPVGFVASPDPRHLVVHARLPAGDPIGPGIHEGAHVGLLGIQLETRRRNRANGVVAEVTPDGFGVAIEESFGNCPQYIQARAPVAAIERTAAPASPEGASLSPGARALVAAADTLFIASVSRSHGGVDVSHRGGKPGFVAQRDEGGATVLTMPDFAGNNFFMTLGNLEDAPRAGLAFVDFASGTLLSLTGTTETIWEGPELDAFAGAERLVRFTVASGVLLDGAVRFVWTEPGYARELARTGGW